LTNLAQNQVKNTSVSNIENVLKQSLSSVSGIGGIVSTVNKTITAKNDQNSVTTQEEKNFEATDQSTTITTLQSENDANVKRTDITKTGGSGELNDVVEKGAEVILLYTAAALSQQPWHACFLTNEAKEKLILLNQLRKAIDCSDDFYEAAALDLFHTPPEICFDSIERTELKAFLAKSSFSTRFTNAKVRHFHGNVDIPFCPLLLDFIKSENQKVEEHSATVNIAIMRNMYHARVTMKSYGYELNPSFIERIDEALEFDSLDGQFDALHEVFNDYGHLWCSKAYLGGKLYNYQSNVEVKKGHEQEVKQQIASNFSAAWYGNAKALTKDGKSSASASDDSSSSMELHARGGDPHLFQQPGAWTFSVRDWESWRVIDYVDVQPTYTLLDRERRLKIERVLNRPKKVTVHKSIPYNTKIHVRRHTDGEIYPLTLINGNQKNVKHYELRDEEPLKGDGMHTLVFPEPGKWEYKVFKPTPNGSESEDFRRYIAGLRPFSIVFITQSWKGTPEPKKHSVDARTTIFAVCEQYLGLDVIKTELNKKFNSEHGWLFVGFKGTKSTDGVRFSRHDNFQIDVAVQDDCFVSVNSGGHQIDLPKPEDQFDFLQKNGWMDGDQYRSHLVEPPKPGSNVSMTTQSTGGSQFTVTGSQTSTPKF